MNCGIIRIKSISKGGIRHVGDEEDRRHSVEKNPDIDSERTGLNLSAVRDDSVTLYQAWLDQCKKLGVTISGKAAYVMEQAVITASPDFFRSLGWNIDKVKTEKNVPDEITVFFEKALSFLEEYIGKENIISATIHYDETTPHMHVDYIPALPESVKKKDVYLKDENGKLIKNKTGHAIRAKDEHGKSVFELVQAPARISRSEFWSKKGGALSYRKLQDAFYEAVSKPYGLDRGVTGTGREHIEQDRYKAEKARKDVEQAENEARAIAEKVSSTEMITDNIKKTATGKLILSDSNKDAIDNLQTASLYLTEQLKKKEIEIMEKERMIENLRYRQADQARKEAAWQQKTSELRKKAACWDRLLELVPKMERTVQQYMIALVNKIENMLVKGPELKQHQNL